MSNGIKKARNVAALGGGALVVAPFVAVGTAEAGTTFTVTNTNDSGAGSLRQAILDANADPDADTVTFAASAYGTITLTSGPIKFESSVDLQGPGAHLLTVAGDGDRIFYAYDNETTIDVTISGMTLTGAESTLYGGAVTLWGEHLTLEDMVITDNTTTAFGGGLFVAADTLAVLDDLELVVRNSTISGNHAQFGGGIALYIVPDGETSSVLIENSTISDNTATVYAGGLLLANGTSPARVVNSTISGNTAVFGGGALVYSKDSTLVLEHSTVTDNVSVEVSPGAVGSGFGAAKTAPFGGGVLSMGSLELDHSVISGNTATISPDVAGYRPDYALTIPATYSMVGDLGDNSLDGTGNLPEGDAKLGPLADNGGHTFTHVPQAGSPLIDAGDPAFVAPPATDQRGFGRVAGGRIDIGAVESGSAVLPPTGAPNGLLVGLGAALLGLGGALHLTGRRKRPV